MVIGVGTVTYLVRWVFGDTFDLDKFNSSHAYVFYTTKINRQVGNWEAKKQYYYD